MPNPNRNKMIGHADAGNVAEQEFFFPATADKPAVTVRARSLDEAVRKLEGTAPASQSSEEETES